MASVSSRGDGVKEELPVEILDEFLRNNPPGQHQVLTRLEDKPFERFQHPCTTLSTETITENADSEKVEIKLYVPGIKVQHSKLLGVLPLKSQRFGEAKNCSALSLRCTNSGLRLRFLLCRDDVNVREPHEYIIYKLPADILPEKSKARYMKDNVIVEVYKRTIVSWRRFYENRQLDQLQVDDVPSTESSSSSDESPAKVARDRRLALKKKKKTKATNSTSSQKHDDSDSGNEE